MKVAPAIAPPARLFLRWPHLGRDESVLLGVWREGSARYELERFGSAVLRLRRTRRGVTTAAWTYAGGARCVDAAPVLERLRERLQPSDPTTALLEWVRGFKPARRANIDLRVLAEQRVHSGARPALSGFGWHDHGTWYRDEQRRAVLAVAHVYNPGEVLDALRSDARRLGVPLDRLDWRIVGGASWYSPELASVVLVWNGETHGFGDQIDAIVGRRAAA